MDNLSLGLKVMGYGLAGVFAVLVITYVVIRLLVLLFPGERAKKTVASPAS